MKKISVLILIILLVYLGYNYFNKKTKDNFWISNNCTRGVPESVINSSLVGNYRFNSNPSEGNFLEEFSIDNLSYSIGQYGCDSFDLKILIPVIQDDKKNLLNYLANELNKIKDISNSQYIFNDFTEKLSEINDLILNKREYGGCSDGFCYYYIVILEPILLNGDEYIPLKITYIL